MNNKIVKFNLAQRKNDKIPDLQAGDIVKIYRKIIEGKKERIQIFEGIIIAINGKQSSSPTITVRKVSNGVGVEVVLPMYSPNIEKIEIIKRAKVRRSKLYYIREKSAKSLRLKYKDIADFVVTEEEKVESVKKESKPSVDDESEKPEDEKLEKEKGKESKKELNLEEKVTKKDESTEEKEIEKEK